MTKTDKQDWPSEWTPQEVEEMLRRFEAADPEPRFELEWTSPYTLLVALVLAARAHDSKVNEVTRTLFAEADTPEKMLALGEEALMERVSSLPFYRNKAKNIIRLSEALLKEHGGQVPNDVEALTAPRSRRCPAWGARRRRSCATWPSASRCSAWTPTSTGWRTAPAWRPAGRRRKWKRSWSASYRRAGAARPCAGSSCTAATYAPPASPNAASASSATCANGRRNAVLRGGPRSREERGYLRAAGLRRKCHPKDLAEQPAKSHMSFVDM